MFAAGEANKCPTCGLELSPISKLPTSYDVQIEEDAPRDPLWERLPATYWRRGRGALVLLGIAGACCFFLPWVHVRTPEIETLSGYDMARVLGWVWGCLVGWVTLLPTVLSRRSVGKMRGARVAAGLFTAVPLVTTLVLLVHPPRGSTLVPIRFDFGVGIYATMILALVALPFAITLGGRADDPAKRPSSPGREHLH